MSKKPDQKKEAAPPVEAPKKEEAKPKPAPAAAPKPEKKAKKQEKGIYTMYKVEGDKVSRQRPICERCGPGYFMADHHERYTCGHCGFTRYKRS